MDASIIVAIITGAVTIVTVILSNYFSNNKTLYRIEQLEKKQDKHNSIIERVYKLEEKEALIEKDIKVANHRIDDLEGFHKHN